MSDCEKCKGKECLGACCWCDTHIRPNNLGSESEGYMLCKKCQHNPKVPSLVKE